MYTSHGYQTLMSPVALTSPLHPDDHSARDSSHHEISLHKSEIATSPSELHYALAAHHRHQLRYYGEKHHDDGLHRLWYYPYPFSISPTQESLETDAKVTDDRAVSSPSKRVSMETDEEDDHLHHQHQHQHQTCHGHCCEGSSDAREHSPQRESLNTTESLKRRLHKDSNDSADDCRIDDEQSMTSQLISSPLKFGIDRLLAKDTHLTCRRERGESNRSVTYSKSSSR